MYEILHDDHHIYFVMELMDMTLSKFILDQGHTYQKGTLTVKQIASFI